MNEINANVALHRADELPQPGRVVLALVRHPERSQRLGGTYWSGSWITGCGTLTWRAGNS